MVVLLFQDLRDVSTSSLLTKISNQRSGKEIREGRTIPIQLRRIAFVGFISAARRK